MNSNNKPRNIQVVLGVWLFVSAFIWPHTTAQMTNAGICGLIAIIFAWIAMHVPQVRYVNTALSIWLLLSTFALPRMSIGTMYNNVLVAIVMFIVSLVPANWQPTLRRTT